MDEDLSSPEVDEEEEALPTAPPTSKTPPQAKRPPVLLKSAKEIELTESEEEDEPLEIMADEDVEEEERKPKPAAPLASKKTKDVLSGELFDVVPSVEKKKKAAKSSGLMLEFDLPPATKKTTKEKESPMDTPDASEKRRDSKSKKKRSKKSRHTREEDEPTKVDGQSGSGGGAVTQAPPISSDDPFGPISALDAWLNADSTDPTVRDVNMIEGCSRLSYVLEWVQVCFTCHVHM